VPDLPCDNGPIYLCVGESGSTSLPPDSRPKDAFKCVTTKEVCPQGTDRAGQLIRIKQKVCTPCHRGSPIPPPRTVPGKPTGVVNPFGSADLVITEGGCISPTKAACSINCQTPGQTGGPPVTVEAFCNDLPSIASVEPTGGGSDPTLGTTTNQGNTVGGFDPTLGATNSNEVPPNPGEYLTGLQTALRFTSNPIEVEALQAEIERVETLTGLFVSPGGIVTQGSVTVPSPLASVNVPASELLALQEKNAQRVPTNEALEQEDSSQLLNLISAETFYDPELNFFKLEPKQIEMVPNNQYPLIFRDEIDKSILEAINLTDSSAVWNEGNFLNVTNEKIEKSLNLDLLTSFKILRYPGGEVVGLEKLLSMVKKHITTGTLNKLDPLFYISTGKAQLQQGFTLLDDAKSSDYAARYSMRYIQENGESLLPNKDSDFKNFQVNRGRVLNEDLQMEIPVDTLLSSTQALKVPNEGIPLDAIISTDTTTPKSVGSSDLLNIGDGGGYYFHVSSDSGPIALKPDSLLESSYYLPDFKKSKVLSLNGKTFTTTIKATSVINKHEFVANDTGASSFEPMYFGINLESVSSSYKDNPLIENYTANYSRITDSDQIARHVNNNAQSLSEFRIGYSDPLYRYILDTGSFTLEQEDFTVYGFKSGTSSTTFNFPKNIPFAVVIVPVAGSKFNPLNGESTLTSYTGSSMDRSLSFKPSVSDFIDGRLPGNLETYNLYNEDGTQRIGLVETPSVQSIGYKYDPTAYYNTFYDGSGYVSGIDVVSSFGISYLMREVLDYISDTTDVEKITWFDIFRRLPFNKFSELFYTSPFGIFDDIKNGFRKGLKVDFVLKGLGSQESILLPEDTKTIIKVADREKISERVLFEPGDNF